MALILSIFPGIDLLGRAFEEEWPDACVVRGPDLLWGGNIRTFHPPYGRFDGVIGGPPCQRFSQLSHVVVHRYGPDALAEDLIPEFERVVTEAQPEWFLMENVPKAPVPQIAGYSAQSIVINNRWFGGEQHRKRRFTFGLRDSHEGDLWRYLDIITLESCKWSPAVLTNGSPKFTNGRIMRLGQLGYTTAKGLRDACRLQGLPEDFLEDAPFTVKGKWEVIGNGVPMPMGRAIARAVRRVLAKEVTDAVN